MNETDCTSTTCDTDQVSVKICHRGQETELQDNNLTVPLLLTVNKYLTPKQALEAIRVLEKFTDELGKRFAKAAMTIEPDILDVAYIKAGELGDGLAAYGVFNENDLLRVEIKDAEISISPCACKSEAEELPLSINYWLMENNTAKYKAAKLLESQRFIET